MAEDLKKKEKKKRGRNKKELNLKFISNMTLFRPQPGTKQPHLTYEEEKKEKIRETPLDLSNSQSYFHLIESKLSTKEFLLITSRMCWATQLQRSFWQVIIQYKSFLTSINNRSL